MLYRSVYDRNAKATRQTYVIGFSRSATEIPATFMTALKQFIRDPMRRQSLLSRIETEVLVPARQSAIDAVQKQARLATLAPIAEARRALNRAAHCFASVAKGPELHHELAGLREAYQQLSHDTQSISVAACTIDSTISDLTHTCAALARAVQALPKRSVIAPETVNAWQRSWYAHQDMLAIVTSRAALKRPAGWSHPTYRALVEESKCAGLLSKQTHKKTPSSSSD
jgi:hypothetical protein